MGTTRGSRRLLTGLVLTMGWLLVAPLAAPAGAAAADQADGLEVFRRDVFVLEGASLVNPTGATDPSATLFNVAGLDLGITWGEWAGAAVTSTARTAGHRTDVRLELSGLVPGGLYSVFWGTLGPDSGNPLCPGVERTLPLPAFPPRTRTKTRPRSWPAATAVPITAAGSTRLCSTQRKFSSPSSTTPTGCRTARCRTAGSGSPRARTAEAASATTPCVR